MTSRVISTGYTWFIYNNTLLYGMMHFYCTYFFSFNYLLKQMLHVKNISYLSTVGIHCFEVTQKRSG
jgi:hypothetical protein